MEISLTSSPSANILDISMHGGFSGRNVVEVLRASGCDVDNQKLKYRLLAYLEHVMMTVFIYLPCKVTANRQVHCLALEDVLSFCHSISVTCIVYFITRQSWDYGGTSRSLVGKETLSNKTSWGSLLDLRDCFLGEQRHQCGWEDGQNCFQ